jgi:ComF family protein
VLQRALITIRDGLLGVAYPQECRVCGGAVESWDDGVACGACWDDPDLTRVLTGVVCARCGAPLAPTTTTAERSAQTTSGRLCGRCTSAPFAAARACGVYSGAFEASILFLKIAPHISPRLRAIICRTFFDHYPALRGDVVIPVPLHRLRERERGFNQAGVIARLVSRGFGLQLDDRSLKRIKPTERHRAGMDASDRALSVERAFEVVRPRLIDGASVLLVDDVYTTGSTICAASQALIDAGAQRVNVLTIARVGER